jgi:RimJ/RimL family protein N-acetyltransferase
MQQLKIVTQRLELIALYPELARAAINDKTQLAQLLNAKVPKEFPPEIMADVMELFAQTLETDPGLVGWWGWYLVLNEPNQERVLIGCAGFTGYPDVEGNLLMGYAVLDAYQNKGYATEAVGGLLHWAFNQPQVMSVTAETYPDHLTSIRVMKKNGMVQLGKGGEEGTVKYGITRSQ